MDYQRPAFPDVRFTDASGATIDYGRRWQDRPGRLPPEDAYSVVTHPERFAPLHAVADALIEYLARCYEVRSTEDLAFAADLMSGHDGALRAVRVTPASTSAAPLTIVFTPHPGVRLHAGVLHDFVFPTCGCDACDETADSAADALEDVVTAVVEGRYQETFDRGDDEARPSGRWAAWGGPATPGRVRRGRSGHPGSWAGSLILGPDGALLQRGEGPSSHYPADRLAAARARLDRLDHGWQPWPLRAA